MSYSPRPCSPVYECRYQASNEDYLISQLKSEIFEREQNKKCYDDLECKFRQLQNDLQALHDVNTHLECEIRQLTDKGNKDIADIRNDNENLLNELNEKIALNKKLYCDNNNLFHELEDKTNQNQNLHDEILNQENLLSKLNEDKINLEREKANLTQAVDDQMFKINELKQQIDGMTAKTNDEVNQLRCRNSQNMSLINQLNDEKNRNAILSNELRAKEDQICCTQHDLAAANDCLSKLENDYNTLNACHNKNNDDIVTMNNNLLKETTCRKQVEDNNKKLEDMICCRENQIQKLSADNDALKCTVDGLEIDNQNLNSHLEGYKNHSVVLNDQNAKLAKELENIAERDLQLRHTLGRVDRLRQVKDHNQQTVAASRDNVNSCLSPCHSRSRSPSGSPVIIHQ